MSADAARAEVVRSGSKETWIVRLAIFASMLFTFLLLVWGLTGDSPFSLEGDEMYCVAPALEMLRRNELNPHWFAHPASTTIYPLYFYYQFLNSQVFHGALADPNIVTETLIYDHVYQLCYLPRFVNVFLLVGSLPFLYLIGRDLFGKKAGVFALCFFPISSLLLFYVQVIRSEAPALFFSIVAVYLSLKNFRRPTLTLHLAIGAVIGLGVSSRYPILAAAVLFVLTDIYYFLQDPVRRHRYQYVGFGLLALVTVVVVFALTTPYFFLDFSTFKHDMELEKAAHGLGCDGLSTLGNFGWYLTDAIPRLFYPIQSLLALGGIAFTILRRNMGALLVIVYVLATIAGTCLHPFHTDKWILPIAPFLAVFAGYGLALLFNVLRASVLKIFNRRVATAMAVTISLSLIGYAEWKPFLECCAHNAGKIPTSTGPLFYSWLLKHVPAGSGICVICGCWTSGHREDYKEKDFINDPSYFNSKCDGKYVSPDDLYQEGYRYFILCDDYFPAYLAEPKHYPLECRFINEFLAKATLIKEVGPKEFQVPLIGKLKQRGGTYKLYQLRPSGQRS